MPIRWAVNIVIALAIAAILAGAYRLGWSQCEAANQKAVLTALEANDKAWQEKQLKWQEQRGKDETDYINAEGRREQEYLEALSAAHSSAISGLQLNPRLYCPKPAQTTPSGASGTEHANEGGFTATDAAVALGIANDGDRAINRYNRCSRELLNLHALCESMIKAP